MTRDKLLSRYFFVAFLLGTTLLFFGMVRLFLVPVLLAAVFSTLFYPLYESAVRKLRGRRGFASLVCCLLLLLVLILPLYLVGHLVAREAVEFYGMATRQVHSVLVEGDAGPLGQLRRSAVFHDLKLDEVDWKATGRQIASTSGAFLGGLINLTSRGTLQAFALLFITLFTMYYFFRDGEALIARIKYLVPMEERYEEAIISRFSAVARATIRGTLLIALLQGMIAGTILWIFGFASPVLWAVVAGVFAVVPLFGAWLVLYPAAFVQLLTGHPWQALGLVLCALSVIASIDVLRPRLVGQRSGMHDLMVFFSTLGGLATFGAMGFIAGPVIAALFLAMIDIYSSEFKQELEKFGPALPTSAMPEDLDATDPALPVPTTIGIVERIEPDPT
ncbi:MAG TPA: AI-2E family transporter [Thermoanaerobaculia bacterium]|nr:AI-2E family transporter [Thermoanaerobaculia bacterium]